MGFSCFSCFGGEKNQHLESPEASRHVAVPSQDEKTASLPRKVSDEPSIIEEENAKARVTECQPKSESALSTPVPETSLLADFKLELPPSPDVKTASKKDSLSTDTTQEQPAHASSENSVDTKSRPRSPTPQPIRAVSSASSDTKPGSRDSSLRQVSTQATTALQTPIDAEEKAALAVPTSSFTPKQSLDLKTANAAEVEPISAAQYASQPKSKATDLKALEAFPTTASQLQSADPPKPTISTNPSTTTPSARRPSYESDTPTTPQPAEAQTNPTPTPRPLLPRFSTAPPSSTPSSTNTSTTPLKAKRQSRLSRFLSTKDRTPQAQPLPPQSHPRSLFVSRGNDSAGKEIGGLPPTAEVRLEEEREIGKEVAAAGEKEVGVLTAGKKGGCTGQEKTSWEKEMEKVRVEGRKWAEGGDNESLFCY